MSHRVGPPLRLSVSVETTTGSVYRWGEDEPMPDAVPSGLNFSSGAVGGFEACSLTLPRRTEQTYPDLKQLSTITIYGPGGAVAWQGRVEGIPRVSGDQRAVTINAVGWQAHLEDDKSASAVYVDRDLSHWQGHTATQKLANLSGGDFNKVFDGTTSPDETNGLPQIILSAADPWAAGMYCAMFYDSGRGNLVESIYTAYEGVLAPDATYQSFVISQDDDAGNGYLEEGATIDTDTAGTLTRTLTTPKRFVGFEFWDSAAETANQEHAMQFRKVTVWGDTGLTKRGTAPNDGLYASDVIAHAVSAHAPRLKVSSDSIQPTIFTIPHLEFRDLTTAAEIIRGANRFHLNDWAVWEGRDGPTFYYYPRGYGRRYWRARIAPTQLEEAGPQVDSLWNGVIVNFRDPDGTTRSAGPPASGANTESDDLEDPDPLSPANQLQIRRWTTLDMGTMSTAAAAVEVGRRFLEESRQLEASGRAQLEGWVEDDHGVKHPAWKVRGGDYISFIDAADTSYRRIVKSSYTHDTRVCSVDLDSPPEGLDELLQRLQVVLVPLGLA
jgi:hypothetical protein